MLHLTKFENIIKYTVGILTLPISPFFFFSVKSNTKSVILRYGKIDRIVNPGLRWTPPGCYIYEVFTGTRIYNLKNLRLIDSLGKPIIISANIEYHIIDVGLYIINANGNNNVLINASSIILKQVYNSIPFVSSNNKKIYNEISELLSKNVEKFGIIIDSINIIESYYTPEFEQQMLIKQALSNITVHK